MITIVHMKSRTLSRKIGRLIIFSSIAALIIIAFFGQSAMVLAAPPATTKR